jgi:hypothetical protein
MTFLRRLQDAAYVIRVEREKSALTPEKGEILIVAPQRVCRVPESRESSSSGVILVGNTCRQGKVAEGLPGNKKAEGADHIFGYMPVLTLPT